MSHILDGKDLAQQIRENIRQRICDKKISPGLAVVLVGDDPASHIYVRIKERACKEAGMHFVRHVFDGKVEEEKIISCIKQLNADSDIHGILVQLPLPSQDTDRVIDAIDPAKDVDGFHKDNTTLVSPVALGVMKLIRHTNEPLKKKHALVIANPLFAAPICRLLSDEGVDNSQIDPDKATPECTQRADILIVGAGIPHLITQEHVKSGAIVIDIGTTKIDGQLMGDVDFINVSKKASWITPVPGGVGPMTVAMLLLNVLKAWNLQNLTGSSAEHGGPKSPQAQWPQN